MAAANGSLNRGQAPLPLQLKMIFAQACRSPARMARSQSYPRKLRDSWMKPTEPVIRLSTAWLAFLALLTYLLVTLAGVSHKALLLDIPVSCPLLSM